MAGWAASAEATVKRLVYAGHVGSGFTDADLEAIAGHLRTIETDESPFADDPRRRQTPHPKEQPHWVHPSLVIDVKFTQWTADEVLRNPVYLGVRTDKAAANVRREDTRTPPRGQAAGLSAVASATVESRRQEKTATRPTRRSRRRPRRARRPTRPSTPCATGCARWRPTARW
jgi:hypothetical protein